MLLAPTAGPRLASAQENSEFVALHPCSVTGEKDKARIQDYELACTTAIARGDVRLVSSEQVRAFLEKEPKKSCALAKKPAECLGRLATSTQAVHAVLITLSPGPLTRASGLVVTAQGEVVDQKSIQLRNRGQPQEELIRTALTRLRDQLNITPMSLPSLVEPPPAPVAEAPAQPVKLSITVNESSELAAPRTPALSSPPAAPIAWKKPVAYTAAGLGVVALGAAGFLALDGERAMRASNAYYDGDKFPTAADVATINTLRETAASRRTLAGVSTAVGAVLAGAGVFLWLQDRPAPSKPGVTAVSAGPGGVSLLGVLP
uniref:Uncharacterized protein n=1 Tax=Melittangium lichenicola TaxID=45 RepID=A0A3Q8I687_9BACT|nr:hypothetical protein [Melittangium lichenicola]